MGSTKPLGESDVVFLFGAGVSVPVGVPAMQGMFTGFLNKSKSSITAPEKRACSFFVDELGVPKDLEEFLLAANSITEYSGTTLRQLVERSVSTRKDAKVVRECRRRLEKHAADAAGVRASILRFMARTCFQFDREKAIATFRPLVTAVAEHGYPVYTTNYDFALEYVAEQSDIAIHDNFLQAGQRFLWNPEIDFPLGDGLTIVKLHGSVTWYSDSDGDIEKLNHYTDINTVGKNVERLVIAPTRFKDIYAQHFFALYSHFLAALGVARVLVIAGHSLRDDYLRAAIVERCRRGNFSLVVIDPKFPDLLAREVRPERAGTAGAVTHVPKKFEDFADEMASIARSATPTEIAAACASVVHQCARSNKLAIKGNVGALKAGATRELTASVDAYLSKSDKPAYVRVWLEGEYLAPDGQPVKKHSERFLEVSPVELGTGWTGVIKSDAKVVFKVPTYPEWLDQKAKVTLRVALVRRSVKTPGQLAQHLPLAQGRRRLTYHR
jgi:hypothetical protein